MNEPGFDKPRPEPTIDSQPFWDGLREHRMVLQQCAGCGKVRHYPRPVCDACYSMDVTWVPAAGAGTVHSWTVCHHPFHMGFKRELPYVVVTVDLTEGVRMVGQVRGIPAEALEVGLPVSVGYEDVGQDLTLPVFLPRAAA